MIKFFPLFVTILLIINTEGKAQNVTVNNSTGTASIDIPLFNVTSGRISVPIGIQYNATAIRTTDVENWAGMNWSLNAGGSIVRELRGLPDDNKVDMANNSSLGWIYNTNQTKINALQLHSNDLTSTPNAQADINSINAAFDDYSDTEPDIFHVDVPGLSCDLIYDQSLPGFRTIPYKDLKITYIAASNGNISSFVLTTDQGETYTFSATETSVMKVLTPATMPTYFKIPYVQYTNGISFVSSWDLTKINDVYGNNVTFTYVPGLKKGNYNSTQLYENGSQTATTPYTIWSNVTPNKLSQIYYGDNSGASTLALTFSYIDNGGTQKSVVSNIVGFGRNYVFDYLNGALNDHFARNFLVGLTDHSECNTSVNYSFGYNFKLPDSLSHNIDSWGYYNGPNTGNANNMPSVDINPSTSGYARYRNPQTQASPTSIYTYHISGSNALPDTDSVDGTLNIIYNANGGYTKFAYEPNDYYDPEVGAVVTGGGIRIKSIDQSDGTGPSNFITKTYSYIDPSTNRSSGQPVSLPVYAFTRPYVGSGTLAAQWTASTVVSTSDLSNQDHSIIYSSVTETKQGMGSILSQYIIPGTNYNPTVPSGFPSWSPTIINSAAYNSTGTGFLINDKNTYPFPPNTNYEFERGLLSRVVNYDVNNNLVSESIYTYQTIQPPIIIPGFKYDINNTANSINCYAFAKYNLYTFASPSLTQVLNKRYNPDFTTYRQTTNTIAYNSIYHRLQTQQTTVNSDGTTTNAYTKYVKDYNATNAADNMTTALQHLQLNNFNLPIEQYVQITTSGGTTTTTHGALTLFDSFANALYLPSQRYKLLAVNGMNNFIPSTTNNGYFSYNATNYTKTENDTYYDYTGNLMTSDNTFKHYNTTIIDHITNQPVALFNNASYSEIAFNDFDSKVQDGLGFTGASNTSSISRTGTHGLSLNAGIIMAKSFTKNPTATNYILSMWVQSGTSGTISASITNGSQTNPKTFTYDNTTNLSLHPTGWQYCEMKLPLTNITTGNLIINFSSNLNIIVDDILTYPDVAQVSTYSYDPITYIKSSETNTNGISNYYTHDPSGILLLKYDQDKNIIERNQYVSMVNAKSFANGGLSMSGSLVTQPVYFDTGSSCATVASGTTYAWTFGDGTTANTTTASTNHTYSSIGTYNGQVIVTSPLLGTKTYSAQVTLVYPLIPIIYSNYTTPSRIGQIQFLQGSTVVYTFTTSQLITGTCKVLPGTYTINILNSGNLYNPSTLQGYSSVLYNNTQCLPYSSNVITFSATIPVTVAGITFTMQTQPCGPPQ